MLIHDRSKMENAMSITYDDLTSALEKYRVESLSRKSFLIEKVSQLFTEYQKSLGTSKNVVKIGVGEGNEFQIVPIGNLNASDDHVLRFSIATGIDGEGFDIFWVTSKIGMWQKNAYLHVTIGESNRAVKIIRGEPEGCFTEVCATIKQQILDVISKNMPQ